VLPLLIYFYCGLEIGTGDVERTLGMVKAVSNALGGAAPIETVSLYAEIIADGPESEDHIFQRVVQDRGAAPCSNHVLERYLANAVQAAAPTFVMQEWGRLLAAAWLAKHGRRFHVYRRTADTGKTRGHVPGSEKAFISASHAARIYSLL
jgi:hypothetical protein